MALNRRSLEWIVQVTESRGVPTSAYRGSKSALPSPGTIVRTCWRASCTALLLSSVYACMEPRQPADGCSCPSTSTATSSAAPWHWRRPARESAQGASKSAVANMVAVRCWSADGAGIQNRLLPAREQRHLLCQRDLRVCTPHGHPPSDCGGICLQDDPAATAGGKGSRIVSRCTDVEFVQQSHLVIRCTR